MNAIERGVGNYLQLRRGMGFKLEIDERHLRHFVAFLRGKRASTITTKLAFEFATRNTALDAGGWLGRLVAIRGFARYWQAFDPETEIPPAGLVRVPKKRAKPRLCSQREIVRLLEAARAGPITATRGLRPSTLYTFFGLLAVTGMRVGEAIALRKSDIDWADHTLTIRDTKFGKSRRVPIHGSTAAALDTYAKRRDRFLRAGWRGAHTLRSDLFFVSNRGSALSSSNLRLSFRTLWLKGGLMKSGTPHMRIHDLRHRFAVETLRRWYVAGIPNIGARLPALSTFLGHVNVAATYWYLSSTPALRAAAMNRVETRWKGAHVR
jgi:integrase